MAGIRVMDTKDEGCSTFQSLQNEALGQFSRSFGYWEGGVPTTITEDAALGQAAPSAPAAPTQAQRLAAAETLEKAAAAAASAPGGAQTAAQMRAQAAAIRDGAERRIFGFKAKHVLLAGAAGLLGLFAWNRYGGR